MQNKIIKSYNTVNDNKIKITQLNNNKTKKVKYLWLHKSRELILLENYNSESLEQVFIIENITENILKYLKIVTYLTNGITSGDDGLKFGNIFSVTSLDTHMVMTSYSTAKLYVKLNARALTDDIQNIPLFWNVKLIYQSLIKRV